MKLAIASEHDFKIFWSIHRALQELEYENSELRRERWEKIILGRLEQLGGGFTRVVMGCETLIDNCCDKSLDHYDFSPEIKAALEKEESQACQDVITERQRQVDAEGWTPEHDDQYSHGELASAASCYATQGRYHYPTPGKPGPTWPWAPEWWKPSDYRRNLVKAGALILAEIERLDRAFVNCHEPPEVQ